MVDDFLTRRRFLSSLFAAAVAGGLALPVGLSRDRVLIRADDGYIGLSIFREIDGVSVGAGPWSALVGGRAELPDQIKRAARVLDYIESFQDRSFRFPFLRGKQPYIKLPPPRNGREAA